MAAPTSAAQASEVGAAQTAAAEEVELPKSARTIQVLVCDGDATHDWPAVFAQHGMPAHLARRLRVVQASWMELSVVVYGGARPRTV